MHDTATSRFRLHKHLVFLAILAFAGVTRFVVLPLAQRHVHSDEAVIGLMGKHIRDGIYYPFYMYGQNYNAAAAWEAYLASVPFRIFGIGVIPLKSCMVVLSLLSLVLVYNMAERVHDRRTAVWAALVFALCPSMLKWHFQVRGYSFYFLFVPLLTILFLEIDSGANGKLRRGFLLGLVTGLALWSLELILPLAATLWLLLLLRRRLTLRSLAVGVFGFLLGYAPALIFNFTHHYANWSVVFGGKMTRERLAALLQWSTVADVFAQELPKFFGTDTVMWYYPEQSTIGWIMYTVAAIAVGMAALPFLKSPGKIIHALRGKLADPDDDKNFLMLVLLLGCFASYMLAPFRVPSYFLGGCFFLSVLIADFLRRCFATPDAPSRLAGSLILLPILATGLAALVLTARHDQIETLTVTKSGGDKFHMTRIPGADLDSVEDYLRRTEIRSVRTSLSFAYPLLFESDERLAAYGGHRLYPRAVPWRMPSSDPPVTWLIETDSRAREQLEAAALQRTGHRPILVECGTLTIVREVVTSAK